MWFKSECFWFQPDRLVIYLGNSFDMDRGKGKIKVKPESLRSSAQNSEFAIGELSPEFPANPPVPAIQVKTATMVGICEDVVMDASGTTGTGGRPLVFRCGAPAVQ